MSKRRELIILEPDGRIRKEVMCSHPITCPYCNGIGSHFGGLGLPDVTCPGCEGTGEVIALVTIDWKPNKQP